MPPSWGASARADTHTHTHTHSARLARKYSLSPYPPAPPPKPTNTHIQQTIKVPHQQRRRLRLLPGRRAHVLLLRLARHRVRRVVRGHSAHRRRRRRAHRQDMQRRRPDERQLAMDAARQRRVGRRAVAVLGALRLELLAVHAGGGRCERKKRGDCFFLTGLARQGRVRVLVCAGGCAPTTTHTHTLGAFT